MTKAFLDNGLPLPDLVVPIPLHKRRLRWRGFNQSELLANYISENLTPGMEIPVLNDILIRKKHTTPQMQVKKYSERKENIKDAFEIYPVKSAGGSAEKFKRIKNKNILLVDDVATTGATLNECAKTLKQSGAKKVFALVLARQEMSKKIK
jgi:ComF family protein